MSPPDGSRQKIRNYGSMATFVKVMPQKPWPLFSGHGVYTLS